MIHSKTPKIEDKLNVQSHDVTICAKALKSLKLAVASRQILESSCTVNCFQFSDLVLYLEAWCTSCPTILHCPQKHHGSKSHPFQMSSSNQADSNLESSLFSWLAICSSLYFQSCLNSPFKYLWPSRDPQWHAGCQVVKRSKSAVYRGVLEPYLPICPSAGVSGILRLDTWVLFRRGEWIYILIRESCLEYLRQ
jgi:hypothetical protein